jgi:hypothetical protein
MLLLSFVNVNNMNNLFLLSRSDKNVIIELMVTNMNVLLFSVIWYEKIVVIEIRSNQNNLLF